MAAVVFGHFAASATALVLRFQSRPTIRCVGRCCTCIDRCCRCFFSGRRVKLEADSDRPSKLSKYGILKWYWFHLSMQVGFMLREFWIVSEYDGWCPELCLAQLSIWFTILLVARELWNFSKVRQGSEKQKVAVDGLIDMLLLPVNIGFFCVLCVRVLKLHPTSTLSDMVEVVIESPEIYEAFALWSVLELFVNSVSVEMSKQSDAADSFKSFKAISLQGVKAWVYIQIAAVAFKLVLQGAIAIYVPTFCNWALESCKSCHEWYEEHAALAFTAVIFLLCSFAIMFVFYFETGYRSYLHKIEPMWKFLGVKGIVSVTYFQWIVISLCATPFEWDDKKSYMIHCLLYAVWMPLLALFHMLLAYPFYTFRGQRGILAPWLEIWLRSIGEEEALEEQAVDSSRRSSVVSQLRVREDAEMPRSSARMEEPEEEQAITEPQLGLQGNATAQLTQHPDNAGRSFEVQEIEQAVAAPIMPKLPPDLSRNGKILYCAFGAISCILSTWIVLRTLPLRVDDSSGPPLYNFTCTGQGELGYFLQSHSNLHFALVNDTVTRYSVPHVPGTWLPLCASTTLGCSLGHYPKDAHPSISCSVKGKYVYEGMCEAISCGQPPEMPHMNPRASDMAKLDFSYGVTVRYDCEKPGYKIGSHAPQATCNVTGKWEWQGDCVEVTCPPPPRDIPNATPVTNSKTISTGMVVRYQCKPPEDYIGAPTATCGDDGAYVKEGRCRRLCGPPPKVDHATPSYNNDNVSKDGWIEGLRAPYTCDPGYVGFVSGICTSDGSYSMGGECIKPDPDAPPTPAPPAPGPPGPPVADESLTRKISALQSVVTIESLLLVLLVGAGIWYRQRLLSSVRLPTMGQSSIPHPSMGQQSFDSREDRSQSVRY